MPKPTLFFDSSALFAGIVSSDGAARALLILAEAGEVAIVVSEQVIAETEKALARKAPLALGLLRKTVLKSDVRIVRQPSPAEVARHAGLASHAADIPIIVAAMQANVDYLATFNRKHFVDDPGVAERAGVRIGSPGDALAWVRAGRLATGR